MALARWPSIAGFRVVMTWPDDSQFAPAPPPRGRSRLRLTGLAGASLVIGGAAAIIVALVSQVHAPTPASSAAGKIGPGGVHGPVLARSLPVSVSIPAIGVRSTLLSLGLNRDGTLQVPSLVTSADRAAWYKNSATPGQAGTSVIEGHVDSYHGPAVFFRLGALRPGNKVDVRLANGVTAIFQVTGVRSYAKDEFPAKSVYGPANYAALRLITCGGDFDSATGHYLRAVVVYASLTSTSHR